MERSHPQRDTRILLSVCVALTVALLWYLHRLTFVGQTLSYDTLIYARSLWGLGHGDPNNPVLGVHALALHGNFTSIPLAPLTQVVEPAVILIVVQALAFGATLAMVAMSLKHRDLSLGYKLWMLAVVVIGTPMLLNPFLFDARPDVVAIPFALAGLLRVQRRGGFDLWAIVWLTLAALTREEFAIVMAAALVFPPPGLANNWTRVRRWAVAACAGVYFLFYWFGVRSWLGHSDVYGDSNAMFQLSEMGSTEFISNKIILLVVFLCSAGALAVVGWRWLGAALPGLAFLLAITWIHEEVLTFHYSAFVAPALIVAASDGLRRVNGPKIRLYALASGAIAIISFLVAGAAPGGGQYRAEFPDIEVTSWLPPRIESRNPAIASARELLATVDKDEGIAVPYMIAADLADRSVIWTIDRFRNYLRTEDSLPQGVGTVALLEADWDALGRYLVTRYGFKLIDWRPGTIALLRTGTDTAVSASLFSAPACEAALAYWPTAGLALCQAEQREDGSWRVLVGRAPSPDLLAPTAWLALIGADSEPTTLLPFRGLVMLEDLPPAATVWLESANRHAEDSPVIVLLNGEGQEVLGVIPGAEDTPLAEIPLRR